MAQKGSLKNGSPSKGLFNDKVENKTSFSHKLLYGRWWEIVYDYDGVVLWCSLVCLVCCFDGMMVWYLGIVCLVC